MSPTRYTSRSRSDASRLSTCLTESISSATRRSVSSICVSFSRASAAEWPARDAHADPMNVDASLPLVTLAEITAAVERIRGVARRTPLVHGTSSPHRALLLKCENMQVAGAFKIRGAANMLARLSREDLARGVITYSSGNHGQALACAARLRGAPAVVVMPTTAP